MSALAFVFVFLGGLYVAFALLFAWALGRAAAQRTPTPFDAEEGGQA